MYSVLFNVYKQKNKRLLHYYLLFCVIYVIVRCIIILYIYTLLYIKKEQKQEEGKGERTRAKDAAAIFASSSPLFCSVCCLHRPHHLQPLTHHYVAPSPKGRAATPSASGRCHRHTSPATRRAATRAVGQPPSLVLVLASLPLFQVVRVGQRASHGGRSPPAHPVDPLHPAGVPRHKCGHLRR